MFSYYFADRKTCYAAATEAITEAITEAMPFGMEFDETLHQISLDLILKCVQSNIISEPKVYMIEEDAYNVISILIWYNLTRYL